MTTRRALDLTQAELARRVACATITIRKIEADALRRSQQIAERLAMALNIPLEERAKFVRLARMALRDTPEPFPLPTPPPTPEEIGQEDLSGRAIRGYELGERIGTDGFGVIYRALQPLTEREVAAAAIANSVVFSPDGTHLATASLHATAKVWDATSGQGLLTLSAHSLFSVSPTARSAMTWAICARSGGKSSRTVRHTTWRSTPK